MKLTSSKLKDIIREVLSEQPVTPQPAPEQERTLTTQEFQERLETIFQDTSRISDMTNDEKARLINTFEKMLDVFDEPGSQDGSPEVGAKNDHLDAAADEFSSKTQTTRIGPTQ